jgi:hypothetical protein
MRAAWPAAILAQSQWPEYFNLALAVAAADATARNEALRHRDQLEETTSVEATARAFFALAGFALAAVVLVLIRGCRFFRISPGCRSFHCVGVLDLAAFAAGFAHRASAEATTMEKC